jgi:hypothetical protein
VGAAPPLVDDATAAFIQGGVSIIAASAADANRPRIARAAGCRVSADRLRVTILLLRADPLTDALRAGRRIAVVFTEPSTHRTIQLKGERAEVSDLGAGDAELTRRYAEAFVGDARRLGYDEGMIGAMVTYDPSELAAVCFEPTAKFLQTPGPRAGTALDSAEGC